jgi:anti-sigma-K factor RskA
MSGAADKIPEELHVLAGEYVLGALDAAEMRAVRQQASAIPMLAAAIAMWEQRLAPMAKAIPPLAPPDDLWARLERAIGPAPAAEPVAEAGPRFALAPETPASDPPARTPANDTGLREAPLRDFPARDAWRSDLSRLHEPAPRAVWPWQVATAGALAFAAGVAAIVLLPALGLRGHLLGSRGAPRVAVIMPADGHTPGFLAEARADGTVVLTAFAPVDVPNGKALELWVLPPGGTVPRSLGVLPAAGTQVVLPSMPAAGTALMVSLEPPGGSPTGLPTGPVVYAGKLQQMQL